jgi:hypothetical protein
MGNNNHVVVGHKLCGFQGCVGRRIVVIKEPVVVALKFWFLPMHIFSQASQNITVEVTVDHSVRRNKFTVNSHLHIEKTMSMLFNELRTCHTFFALGDCGLFYCSNCCFVSGS